MNDSNTAASTKFSKVIATLSAQDDHLSIALPSDWLQGRTSYGGLSAALCLESTLRAFTSLPPLRSAQFSFVGPASGVLRITPTVLRQGKSSVFTSVDLEGESGLAVRGTLCFGAERPVSHEYAKHLMPDLPPSDACQSFYTWPDRPNFMSHFDGRLAAGGAPMTSGTVPEMLVWLRHRDSEVSDSIVSLLALADALPPASFVLFREKVPISTMTWSIDMLEADPKSPTGWWLVRSAAETVREGYSAQTIVIWSPDGRPILSARQNVAIFAKK